MTKNWPSEEEKFDQLTVEEVKERRFNQNACDAYEKLRPESRRMKSKVHYPGNAAKDWIVGAGNAVGCASTKKGAQKIAIVRECLDPDFTGDAPARIPGIQHGEPNLTDAVRANLADTHHGEELTDTASANLETLTSALCKSYGRPFKSYSVYLTDDGQPFRIRIRRKEILEKIEFSEFVQQ